MLFGNICWAGVASNAAEAAAAAQARVEQEQAAQAAELAKQQEETLNAKAREEAKTRAEEEAKVKELAKAREAEEEQATKALQQAKQQEEIMKAKAATEAHEAAMKAQAEQAAKAIMQEPPQEHEEPQAKARAEQEAKDIEQAKEPQHWAETLEEPTEQDIATTQAPFEQHREQQHLDVAKGKTVLDEARALKRAEMQKQAVALAFKKAELEELQAKLLLAEQQCQAGVEEANELLASQHTCKAQPASPTPSSITMTELLSPLASKTSSEWSQDAQDPNHFLKPRQLFPSPPKAAPTIVPSASAKAPNQPCPPATLALAKAPACPVAAKLPGAPLKPATPTLPKQAAAKNAAPAATKTAAAQPPASLSAINKRIARAMEPNAKGFYKVSEQIRNQWKAGGDQKNQVLRLFAQCNYDTDCLEGFKYMIFPHHEPHACLISLRGRMLFCASSP